MRRNLCLVKCFLHGSYGLILFCIANIRLFPNTMYCIVYFFQELCRSAWKRRQIAGRNRSRGGNWPAEQRVFRRSVRIPTDKEPQPWSGAGGCFAFRRAYPLREGFMRKCRPMGADRSFAFARRTACRDRRTVWQRGPGSAVMDLFEGDS